MTWYDISRQIFPGAVVYPGDDPISLDPICEIGPEAPCRITSLSGVSTHVLTHIDAPAHFIAGGRTLSDFSVNDFLLPAVVVHVSGEVVEVANIPTDDDLAGGAVLFKTANSAIADQAPFVEGHSYISAEAAEALASLDVALVGIDYLSVDRFGDEEYPVHKALLRKGILVLEGLYLADVPEGLYSLYAFPLRIRDADGSPVRAVLSSPHRP